MNGVHDMGGMQGMGPVAVREERACVPRAVGRTRLCADAARCAPGANGSRHRSALARAHAAGRLSANELLRAMAGTARSAGCEVRPRDASRDWRRGKADAGSAKVTAGSHAGNVVALAQPRHSFESRIRRFAAVQGGPARARPQHQSHRPHPPAAVRARQDRHHRSRPRRLRLPRHQRPFPG